MRAAEPHPRRRREGEKETWFLKIMLAQAFRSYDRAFRESADLSEDGTEQRTRG
jgi:hypothetical protein